MNTRFTLITVYLTLLLAALLAAPASCQAQKPQLVVQTGHIGSIWTITFSPDGKTLASASIGGNGTGDNTIKIWDVATGYLLHNLTGHIDFVDSLAFSPNGKTLASASRDKTVKLWDTATGKASHTLVGHTGYIYSVAFSRDGRRIASSGQGNGIKLWDTATGKELHTFTGHSSNVTSLTFSPNGETLTSFGDHDLALWDITTGHELYSHTGYANAFWRVAFSPDGNTFASASRGKTVKLWDTATGMVLHTLAGHSNDVTSVAFSPDGRTLASGSEDDTIKLWDTTTGQLRTTLAGHSNDVTSVAFSPDGRTLASGSDDHTIKLWNADTGEELHTLEGHTHQFWFVAFSPDGRTLAAASRVNTIKLWDTATGQQWHNPTRHIGFIISVNFSSDGKAIASASGDIISASEDNTLNLWDITNGLLLRTLTGHTDWAFSVAFSPDGETLASGSADHTIKLWDTATGRLLNTLTGHADSVMSVAFSPSGKLLASGSKDKTIKIWDTATGKELHTLTEVNSQTTSVAFSPDGKTIVGSGQGSTIKLWDTATGQLQKTLTGRCGLYSSVAFSPDGKLIACGCMDDTIKVWDTATGSLFRTLIGHTDAVGSVAFSPDGKTIASGSGDCTIKLWNTINGRESASLYAFGEDDWAVVTPEGRFDVSPGGLTEMHYVVGLEPIELAQLKDRYYEPGLLAKLLGYNKEPLRDVQAFDHVNLYPSVKAPDAVPTDGKMPLTLTNRGGGIGRVQVFVNGKELLADARGPKPDPAAKTAALTVDVSHAPGLVPGKPNTVRVVTWNAEGYLSSRGTEAVYTPPGRAELAPPDLWAIVGGISDYAGPSLHLTYPAKDAADFAHALTLAARNLFGADKVHLTLLDTGGQPGALTPTKANLRQAFQQARKAKPGDIFVVYLAGHGVALPGPSDSSGTHDLYCYLTQDATTGSPATLGADTALRSATTVSSEELTDWIKQVPAQKQVMVLDTCAAGAAAALLTAKRDIPSDQIRAIERLKDRTGFYVLMGCAADAVSYETSRYRQGLLTYSLLKGMKGASLRDGQYVDVSGLFNYAVDAVPRLAQNIGGVQRPFVAAPQAGSFDVGELSAADRQAIPLASAGALLLRPELLAEDEDLGLEALLAARLRDAGAASARGDAAAPALSFVDASDFPGALRPQGTYTVSGQAVAVKLRLRRDGKVVNAVQVTGTRADLPGLIAKLASAILGAVGTP